LAQRGFFSGLVLGIIVAGAIAAGAALVYPLAPGNSDPETVGIAMPDAPDSPDTDAPALEPQGVTRVPAVASGRLLGGDRPAPIVDLDPVVRDADSSAGGSPSLVPLGPERR
jgi:hypothetical protein